MINKFGIHIKVKDINRSYDFYKSFKFKPIFAYGNSKWLKLIEDDYGKIPNAPEKYNGVTFEIENALFEIADGHIAVKPDVFQQDISSSKVSAMLDVKTVDEIVDICKKNNYIIAKEPVEYPWGTKEVVIKDPDGFILVFREVYYMK